MRDPHRCHPYREINSPFFFFSEPSDEGRPRSQTGRPSSEGDGGGFFFFFFKKKKKIYRRLGALDDARCLVRPARTGGGGAAGRRAAAPEPGPGEVRVRVSFRGSTPATRRNAGLARFGCRSRGDPAQRRRRRHRPVGEGVDPRRVGQRVWVFGAQSYRPFGTAAQLTVVPAEQAVDLPDDVSDEVGACLGIPGSPRTGPSSATAGGGRDGPRARRSRRRGLTGRAARPLGRRHGHRHRAAQQRRRGTRPDHRHAPRRARQPTPPQRSADTRPTASTASSRSRFSDNVDLDAAVAGDRVSPRSPPQDRPLPVLADAVRQRHDPAARQRRLPGRREAEAATADDGSRKVRSFRRRSAALDRTPKRRPRRRRRARASAQVLPPGSPSCPRFPSSRSPAHATPGMKSRLRAPATNGPRSTDAGPDDGIDLAQRRPPSARQRLLGDTSDGVRGPAAAGQVHFVQASRMLARN